MYSRYLTLFSVAVIKTLTKSKLGRKNSFGLDIQVTVYRDKSKQELEAGT